MRFRTHTGTAKAEKRTSRLDQNLNPMKKVFYSLGAVLCLTLASNKAMAQYEQGQSDINLGVGFVSSFTGGGMPFSLSYDYGLTDNISLGGIFAYASGKEDFSVPFFGDYSWKYTNMVIGVRGMYHLDLVDNMDTYGGIMLGYNLASAKFDGDEALEALVIEPTVGGFSWGVTVGGRYHFTDNFGAFLELGYGLSVVNVGLTMKM